MNKKYIINLLILILIISVLVFILRTKDELSNNREKTNTQEQVILPTLNEESKKASVVDEKIQKSVKINLAQKEENMCGSDSDCSFQWSLCSTTEYFTKKNKESIKENNKNFVFEVKDFGLERPKGDITCSCIKQKCITNENLYTTVSSCLPPNMKLSDVVSREDTISSKLKKLQASCLNNELVDASGKKITFYNSLCYGVPPPEEYINWEKQRLENLQKNYNVVIIDCSPFISTQ